MEFLSAFEKNLTDRNLAAVGSHVLLAVSGGMDSVCLLRAFAALREKLKLMLTVCHVHHGLRGESAEGDASFVEALCAELSVPCIVRRIDTAGRVASTGESVEEAARILRYEALFRVKAETGADRIATAHHQDDQAETILFQLIRGSALEGLSGMRAERDGLIRPLLAFSRTEIVLFMSENGYAYRTDETNADVAFSRNRIRASVLPELSKIRPDAAEKIADTGAYLEKVYAYLNAEAEVFLSRNAAFDTGAACCRIGKAALSVLPEVLAWTAVKTALRRIGCPMKDKGRAQFETVRALSLKPVGKRADLGSGYEAFSDYDAVVLRVCDRQSGEKTASGTFFADRMSVRVFPREKDLKIPEKVYTKWFDYDRINGQPVLRKRLPGDRFSTRPGTHKKLNDFFTDVKIPVPERDGIPVVASGADILWAVGVRMSEAYKVTDETVRIMEITIRGDDDERSDQCDDYGRRD